MNENDETIRVPGEALDRLLDAAEAVGGEYEGVHPVLRECHLAARAMREALLTPASGSTDG